MPAATRIAIIGAGVIGRRHAAWLRREPNTLVCGIADPSEAAQAYCASEGLPWFADHRALLDTGPDGVIVATPNALHLAHGQDCLHRRLPMLMEKPVADSVASAREFTLAARKARVPVLVGHYRRHSPIVAAARDIIAAGALGRLVAINLRLMFLKPDDYFAPAWRSQPGGGPVLINFVHDIDALRFMCGEVESVQAMASHAVRGHAVEDTACIGMMLTNGAMVSATLSDTIASPYSWDLNAGEEPSFPLNGKDAYLIGGIEASLALPSLSMWSYAGPRGWMHPLVEQSRSVAQQDPYIRQCRHFLQVVRGQAEPLVTAEQSTRSQMVAEAIAEAAATGRRVDLAPQFSDFDRALGS